MLWCNPHFLPNFHRLLCTDIKKILIHIRSFQFVSRNCRYCALLVIVYNNNNNNNSNANA